MKRPPRFSVPAFDAASLQRPAPRWEIRPTLFWITVTLGGLLALHVFQLAFSGQSQPLNHVGPVVTPLVSASTEPAAALATPEPVVVSSQPEVVSRQPYVRAWIPSPPPATAAVMPRRGQTASGPQNGPAPLSVAPGPQAAPLLAIPEVAPSAPAQTVSLPTAEPTARPTPRPSVSTTPSSSPSASPTPRPRHSPRRPGVDAVCEEISHEPNPAVNVTCRG